MKSTLDFAKKNMAAVWKLYRDFAHTKKLVRVSNSTADLIMGQDFEVEGVWMPASDLMAVQQVWFAKFVEADVSTINRWIHKGMPVLDDATLPLREARDWVHEWREHTGENDRRRYELLKQVESLKA